MKRGRSGEDDDDVQALLRSTRPSCAIFDLDSTVWNGNCENFSSAAFVGDAEAVDTASGRSLKLFPEVKQCFSLLEQHDVPIGIASASPAAATAARLLRGFGLKYQHSHIAPGRKDTHLKSIASKLKISLAKALFFDDLIHNIRTAENLGVGGIVQVQGDRGATMDDLRRALRRMRDKTKGAALMRAFFHKVPPAASAPPPSTDDDEPVDCAAAPPVSAGGRVSSTSCTQRGDPSAPPPRGPAAPTAAREDEVRRWT